MVASLGLPSKTGRKGSVAPALLFVGIVLSLTGAILLFNQGKVIVSVVSIVAVFLIPGTLAYFRK